jgi:hypothetical protein
MAAIACDRLVREAGGRTRIAAAGLLALVAVTWLPAPPPTFPQPVPAYFTTAARALPDGSVALVTPWPRGGVAQAMVWQAASGPRFRLVGGYFLYADGRGNEFVGAPPSPLYDAVVGIENGERNGSLAPADRGAYLAELRRDGVTTVVVAGTTWHLAEMREFFAGLLGRAPVAEGGVLVWSLS